MTTSEGGKTPPSSGRKRGWGPRHRATQPCGFLGIQFLTGGSKSETRYQQVGVRGRLSPGLADAAFSLCPRRSSFRVVCALIYILLRDTGMSH